MPDINPSLPIIGQPDSTEEPKVVTALSQLIAAVNDVDTDQIADGTITAADLAAVIQEALFAPGDLKITAHATADSGWLICDGSAVSRATYAALYTKISTTYGAGDGTTTFNLPDLRGRTAVGVDDTAGRRSANDALGNSGGAETHAIGYANLPSVVTSAAAGGTGFASGASGGAFSLTLNGAGTALNTTDPYQVVNYQIKT